MNTLELARHIVNALEDKKGEGIVLLDVKDIVSFTDYFIICSGTSDRMLDSLAGAAFDAAKPNLERKPAVEGRSDSGWIVLDAGDIVVHLFSPDQRDYYRIEQLWDKAKILVRVQ